MSANGYANECGNASAENDVAAEMRNVFSIESASDCGSAYDAVYVTNVNMSTIYDYQRKALTSPLRLSGSQ